jgi:hypothetical protein
MNVILAQSGGRPGASFRRNGDRQLGVYECCDVTVSANAQDGVFCVVIRAVALSPSRQRRQFREKRAELSVGRQARHTITTGHSVCVQPRSISVSFPHSEQLVCSPHC